MTHWHNRAIDAPHYGNHLALDGCLFGDLERFPAQRVAPRLAGL